MSNLINNDKSSYKETDISNSASNSRSSSPGKKSDLTIKTDFTAQGSISQVVGTIATVAQDAKPASFIEPFSPTTAEPFSASDFSRNCLSPANDLEVASLTRLSSQTLDMTSVQRPVSAMSDVSKRSSSAMSFSSEAPFSPSGVLSPTNEELTSPITAEPKVCTFEINVPKADSQKPSQSPELSWPLTLSISEQSIPLDEYELWPPCELPPFDDSDIVSLTVRKRDPSEIATGRPSLSEVLKGINPNATVTLIKRPNDESKLQIQREQDTLAAFAKVKEDARQALIKKLDSSEPWNLLVPESDPVKMRAFLENKEAYDEHGDPLTTFDEFYTQLSMTMAKFTEEDMKSIGINPSTHAKEFLSLLDVLNENGFPNVNGRGVVCWSGEPFARGAAYEAAYAVSDSKAGAMNAIFTVCDQLRGKDKVTFLMDKTISRSLAAQATGIVFFFYNGVKHTETFTGVPVGNIFDEAERPILQKRMIDGDVTAIYAVAYDPIEKTWLPPVNINDPNNRLLRRNYHPMDPIERRPDFLNSIGTEWHGDYNKFCEESLPRSYSINNGQMQSEIEKWKKASQTPGKISTQVKKYEGRMRRQSSWAQLLTDIKSHPGLNSPKS